LDKVFLPKPLIKKPRSGIKGTSQTKSMIILYSIYFYHLRRFNTFISVDCVFRYTITMMLKPMATSAAASAIIKNTNTCPEGSLLCTEKAVKSRFTAFSINSTDIKITIAFRRVKTPTTPIVKIIALNQM
jgi:hypothetical protein